MEDREGGGILVKKGRTLGLISQNTLLSFFYRSTKKHALNGKIHLCSTLKIKFNMHLQ